MRAATGLLDLIPVEKTLPHLKAGDESRTARRYVPVTRDLGGIFFRQHGIEDRLIGQTRRKRPHAALTDQLQFFRADRPPKRDGLLAHEKNAILSAWLMRRIGASGSLAGAGFFC